MKIGIIASDYPSPGSNRGAFVQARVELYRRMGHQVSVTSRGDRYWVHDDLDVVAVHYPLPDFAIPMASTFLVEGIPVVCYLHGAEAIRSPGKPLIWGWKAKRAVRAFLPKCAAVVTESKWMRVQIKRYFRDDFVEQEQDDDGRMIESERIRVIPNPVDPDLFPFMPHDADAGLCLRGDGWKYGADLLRNNGERVHVLTPRYRREELPHLLSGYGFFVAPSRLEGQGLMACEAAATGMPVVTTDAGGIPEFISGWPHEIVKTPPTAKAVEKAVRLMRGRLPLDEDDAWDVRERILATCGPEETVERDIELFQSVIR